MIDWVESFRKLSDERWLMPIEVNKWSIAEIVSHFVPWEEFVLENRIPYLTTDNPLPKPPDVETLNQQSAVEGRNNPKEITIQKFIDSRKRMIDSITSISDRLWDMDIEIGTTKLSLFKYFDGLVQHDEHHKRQIENALK